MPVVRTYACTDCGHRFDKFHMNRDEPAPECPFCEANTENVPGGFHIKTNKSRAVDMAQQVAEQSFGFTDMKDNLREGDIAAPGVAPMQTAEREKIQTILREQAAAAHQAPSKEYGDHRFGWGGGGQQPMVQLPQAAPGAIAQYSKETAASGLDAVSLVEKAKSESPGRLPKLQVLSKSDIK